MGKCISYMPFLGQVIQGENYLIASKVSQIFLGDQKMSSKCESEVGNSVWMNNVGCWLHPAFSEDLQAVEICRISLRSMALLCLLREKGVVM